MVVLVDAFWNAPSIFWHLLATFRRQRKLPPHQRAGFAGLF
jgi:hypothetical protein